MNIGVIGGGAWGSALAQSMASDGSAVTLWARESDVVTAINQRHENPKFLPGIALNPHICATNALADLAGAPFLLAVAPAQFLGQVIEQLPEKQVPLILCSKGMEQGSGRLMCDVARDCGWTGTIAVLSGPSFAHEVAAGLPAAVTLAADTFAAAETLSALVARPALRPYASDDVIGAEIGGVIKNVLAIACGVVEGAKLGQSARSALIARGFAEMTRYALARGGRAETMAGLSGLGDLVLTCSSKSSRNFSLGFGLGEGALPSDLLSNRASVAEGAFSAPVLAADAAARGVDMPICAAVADLIAGRSDAGAIIHALMRRPLAREGMA